MKQEQDQKGIPFRRNIKMRIKITPVAFLAAMALPIAGCGSSTPHKAAATPAPATQPPPGPERFVAEVRATGLGNKDLTQASDSTLINIGSEECGALTSAGSSGTISGYSYVLDSLMKTNAKPTAHQAAVLVDSAIRNLCPENSNMLPSGAP